MRFPIKISLFLSLVLVNSTCVPPSGSACGAGTQCSYDSSSYAFLDFFTGDLELFNLCHSGNYGSILPYLLVFSGDQLNIKIMAEYTNDLLLDFMDVSSNILFTVGFGTYSGTTAEILSSSFSPLYQNCQTPPDGSLQSNVVTLNYLGNNQILIHLYFQGTQVGCATVDSSFPVSFRFTCWNALVVITSVSITSESAPPITASPIVPPTVRPTTPPTIPPSVHPSVRPTTPEPTLRPTTSHPSFSPSTSFPSVSPTTSSPSISPSASPTFIPVPMELKLSLILTSTGILSILILLCVFRNFIREEFLYSRL